MKQHSKTVFESVSELLNSSLSKFKDRTLNYSACIEIYNDIFTKLVDIVTEISSAEQGAEQLKFMSNDAINFAAQLFYFAVEINGKEILDPTIFTQKTKISDLKTTDLVKLYAFFDKTPFSGIIAKELKNR